MRGDLLLPFLVIDTEKFVANAKKLGAYCTANPNVGLITAMDALFKK